MLKVVEEYRLEVDLQWVELSVFMIQNSDRFKLVIEQWKEMFRRMYAAVCTRCFGYYMDYTFLAPFADCVNHTHSYDNSFILVNKELHQ